MCLLQKRASERVPYWAAPCCYLYKSYDIIFFFLTTTAKKSTIQVLQIIHNGLFLHCIHYSHKGFGRRYLYHTLTFLQRSWAFERSSTWRNEIVPQKWFGSSIGFFFFCFHPKRSLSLWKNTPSLEVFIVLFSVKMWFLLNMLMCAVWTRSNLTTERTCRFNGVSFCCVSHRCLYLDSQIHVWPEMR